MRVRVARDGTAGAASVERDAGTGIASVRRVPANVGNLDLRSFPHPSAGGDPAQVARLISYFLPARTHLMDVVGRGGSERSPLASSSTIVVPGRRIEVPLYVLTSSATFSGGEECAYDPQAFKRARLVGERTGGGAHLGNRSCFRQRRDEDELCARAAVPAGQTYVFRSRAGGMIVDPSSGFVLPDGSVLGPDASWICAEGWRAIASASRPTIAAQSGGNSPRDS